MIPIPLSDENPTVRRPVVTKALIAVNAAVWIVQLWYGVERSVLDYGAISSWILTGQREGAIVLPPGVGAYLYQEIPWPLTLFTSMFMHGGWLHIISNMWFLWIFGDNIEDEMGHGKFLVFYLLCGLLAAGAQILVTPDSVLPMVGASGAIAGVLGAYIVLHPHARVRALWILIIFITFVRVPAWLLLGLWFLSQFAIPQGSSIAWMAHVGGFVAGALLVWVFTSPRGRGRPRVVAA